MLATLPRISSLGAIMPNNTGEECRISRNRLYTSPILSILKDEVIQMPDPMFDRAAFIRKVRETFAPLEALLPEGDAFDYDEAMIFSGVINGSQEHVVSVPMTTDSPSK